MEIKNFEELREKIVISKKKTVAVVCAHDEHTLEAVLKAYEENLLDYYLIGQKKEIIKKAEKVGFEIQTNRIVDCITDEESAKVAVHMAKERKVDFIQKGLMQTSTLLKAVVNKESGIGKGTPMSHIALLDIPGYHKILGVTDGGMILYPDLEMKKAIIKNTAEMFRKAGYVKPKIAVVCAVEVENLKMPETVDAALTMHNTLKPDPANGDWEINGTDFRIELNGNYGTCFLKNRVPELCKLEMEIVLHKGVREAGIALQLDEDFDKGYYLSLQPGNSRLEYKTGMRMYAEGGWAFPYDVEMERPITLAYDVPHKVKVFVQGTILVCYVDDEIALNTRMYDFTDGYFGLFASCGNVEFKNVKLWT